MKTTFIVVNYNADDLTEKRVREFLNYGKVDSAIVVNNRSSDDPALFEKRFLGMPVKILNPKENLGFDRGNNLGIEYADQELHSDYVVWANFDCYVPEESLNAALELLQREPSIGCVSCVMLVRGGKVERCADSFATYPVLLKSCSHLWRRRYVRKHISDMSKKQVALAGDIRYRLFDWVSGGFMCCRTASLRKSGGFDPNIFMYMDEPCFCWRLKEAGFSTAQLADHTYFHNHIEGKGSLWPKIKAGRASTQYWIREYLKCGWFKRALYSFCSFFHQFESYVVLSRNRKKAIKEQEASEE